MRQLTSLKIEAMPRQARIILQVLADVASVAGAYACSLFVRFAGAVPGVFRENLQYSIAAIVLIYLIVYNTFSLYRSFSEQSNMERLIKVQVAAACGGASVYILTRLLSPKSLLPISVYVAGTILSMLFTSYSRLNYYARNRIRQIRQAQKMERAMIIGAGDTGEIVIRQLFETRNSTVLPVVIVDDDDRKQYHKLHGIRVAGKREDIPRLVERYQIDVIIFCMPSVGITQKREILRICSETKCKIRTVPDLDEIMHPEQLTRFRKFEMSDLLPRPEIRIDVPGIRDYLTKSCVLVTGGGGSIGSELCRQIALFEPEKLVIFDIYENTAYDLQMEMRHCFPCLPVFVEIGSVRDPRRLEELFSRYKPDVVFHAAAHKHVPLMEVNPAEAVKNNVFGTLNTAMAADRHRVRRFVLISTDKAVRPTSVMGATKRLAEYVVQYMNSFSGTLFLAVRFGNVLGSNGSVIPLFQKQIELGGPVTVTHKDITRYFMTIPEAARLVLQAGSLAHRGEIFILDMGEPVRIDDVARLLIQLSGYQPDVDIKIQYTGLRPGEKLCEELFMDEERTERTEFGGIMVGKAQPPPPEETRRILDWLQVQIDCGTDVRECLKSVLKSYCPSQAAERKGGV